ncbi:MAG: AraC family transcriptional regulator [Verrucomicrobiota bacterium]
MNTQTGLKYRTAVNRFKLTLAGGGSFEQLFDYLPDIYFFVKDEHYKLVMCNQISLKLFGLKEKAEVIGKSEYDFFPEKLAQPIHQDDISVMEQGREIINRIELIVDENGLLVWVSTNKLPLLKKDGSVAGLMGTTRVLQHADMVPEPYRRHAQAMDHIKKNYDQPISIKKLAAMSNLSVSRFRETFTRTFKLSPLKFILKTRVQVACQQLSSSDEEIAAIAQNCGFCDQSYLTRQFQLHIGLTPKSYRALYSRRK